MRRDKTYFGNKTQSTPEFQSGFSPCDVLYNLCGNETDKYDSSVTETPINN